MLYLSWMYDRITFDPQIMEWQGLHSRYADDRSEHRGQYETATPL